MQNLLQKRFKGKKILQYIKLSFILTNRVIRAPTATGPSFVWNYLNKTSGPDGTKIIVCQIKNNKGIKCGREWRRQKTSTSTKEFREHIQKYHKEIWDKENAPTQEKV